jgi:tetratricopeptide (TPR) repeat protein
VHDIIRRFISHPQIQIQLIQITDGLTAPLIGIVYTRLGLIEEAIDWYERGVETLGPFNYFSAMLFRNDSALWNHPRYQTLLEKMNLDDASVASAKAAVTSQ